MWMLRRCWAFIWVFTVIVSPLNCFFRISSTFLEPKILADFVPILNDKWHWSLKWWMLIFSKFTLNFFDRYTRNYLQNLIGYDSFLWCNKQKLLDMRIFPKIASIAKRSYENDYYDLSGKRSRTTSGLSHVT